MTTRRPNIARPKVALQLSKQTDDAVGQFQDNTADAIRRLQVQLSAIQTEINFLNGHTGGGGADAETTFALVTITSSLPNARALAVTSDLSLADGGAGNNLTFGLSPFNGFQLTQVPDVSASYVVITATGSLPNERAIAGGSGITLTDGGAGGSLTISARPSLQPCGSASITFSTSTATFDAVAFTVPSSPTGAGRFLLTLVMLRLDQQIVGSASVGMRVGSTVGGLQFVTNQSINSGTALGQVSGGLNLTTLGSHFSASYGYTALLSAGDTVNFRASTTGTLSAGAATCYTYGAFLP